MLHWKRASTLTLSKSVVHAPNSAIEEKENYNSFFTEDKELWSSASIFGDIEAILKKPSMQENCQHTADQLWNDDETVVPVKEVAAYLGKRYNFRSRFHLGPPPKKTCRTHFFLLLFVNNFTTPGTSIQVRNELITKPGILNFSSFSFLSRCVCGKLYFKAEAQEIDRILQAFAYRYWCCNKQSKLLYNAGKLHIVQGLGHHRMSRSEFCENTMATITNSIFLGEQHNKLTWEHDMESYLKETYTSVKFQGILQPSSVKTNEPTIAKESSGVATTTKSLLQRMGSKKQSSPSSHRRKVNVSIFTT
ncbi:hypothetical protein BC941DRAFT_421917 [Chlamydoabsidia padenii]|nr:hypothetical protein BC941DRAFT_421917 [Chlamydoabsidia padenii]